MQLRRLVTTDGHPCYLSPGRVLSIVPTADVVNVTVMEREILGSGHQGERTRHWLIEGGPDAVAAVLFGTAEVQRGD